jgi:superfamily II DNA or RNA helicase
MIELRGYQHEGIAACREAMLTARRVLYVAPTGAGKTVLFAAIAQSVAAKGKRALILVHRRELVRQTVGKLEAFGIEAGLVVAGKAADLGQAITMAAVQTLAARPDLELQFDLVVIDEAHHAAAETWGKVLAGMPRARVLGVTATPERLDGKGLGDVFDVLVAGPTVSELIEQGYLADHVCYARSGAENALRSIRKVAGDYSPKAAADLMMGLPVTAAAISDWRELAGDARGFAFACTVAHAEAVALAFTAAGIPATSIDGSMPVAERDSIVARFAAGEIRMLASCELLSEGFDAPDASVAVLLRPTLSRALFRQQVGRVLRPKTDGSKALLLDYAGNLVRHGLPTMEPEWTLEGRPKRQRDDDIRSPIKTCPSCAVAVPSGCATCASCGYAWPIEPAELRPDRTGERVRIDAITLAARAGTPLTNLLAMATSRKELHAIAKQRGFKPGWVHYAAKEIGLR